MRAGFVTLVVLVLLSFFGIWLLRLGSNNEELVSRIVALETHVANVDQALESIQKHMSKETLQIGSDSAVGSAEPLEIGTTLASLKELYTEYAEDIVALKQRVMRWANETDLHQGILDIEAEIIYLRLRKLKPSMVAELGFGQGLATRYFLQALEDNGKGHLYTFDLEDKWNRAPLMALTHRWTFTLGDGRKTLGKFGPYQYVHSDCEHSVDFARYISDWLKYESRRIHSPILFSFHDVYKWPPGSPQARCEGGMDRSSTGTTPEGDLMLKFAKKYSKSPPRSSFTVAFDRNTVNYDMVQEYRHAIGLDDDWVADHRKYKDPKNLRKGSKVISRDCSLLLSERILNPMIFFEV